MGRRCSSELSATYADIGDLAGPYADIGDLAGPPRRHRRPCRTLPARSLNFASFGGDNSVSCLGTSVTFRYQVGGLGISDSGPS